MGTRRRWRGPSRRSGLHFVEAGSGYLVQKVDAATGAWKDAPRGSGTALAAFALAFVDAEAAKALDGALARAGRVGVLGLGGVREYAPGTSGPGDADSGPIVFGMSVAATGFALASARIQGERDRFRELTRSVELLGAPRREGAAPVHGRGRSAPGTRSPLRHDRPRGRLRGAPVIRRSVPFERAPPPLELPDRTEELSAS